MAEEEPAVVVESTKEGMEEKDVPQVSKSVPPAPVEWPVAWESAASTLARLSMTVDKAEAVGSALSKHVVYSVRSRIWTDTGDCSRMYDVQRRFSEFVTLREVIVKRYQGLLIPPIPPKALTGYTSKTESRIVRSRTRTLRRFVSRLAALPWLSDDSVVRSFCSEEYWVHKEEDERVIHDSEATTTGRGRAMWYAALAKAPPPPQTSLLEKKLAEAAGRCEALEKSLEGLLKAATKAAQACAFRADGLVALCDGVAPWRGESARFSALEQAAGRPTEAPTAERAAAAVASAIDKWATEAKRDGISLELELGDAAHWQALNVAAMRELIAQRSSLLEEVRKEQKSLAALRQQKASGTAADQAEQGRKPNFFQSLTKKSPLMLGDLQDLDQQIEESLQSLDDKQKALDLHERALSYCELDRFRQNYAHFATSFARQFFKAQLDATKATHAIWDCASGALGNPQPLPHWMQLPNNLRLPSVPSDEFDEEDDAN